MRILILSTVHNWNDPRIFHKQACTLAKEHEVILAAVGEGPERMVNGVRVRLIGAWTSRFDRVRLWLKAYREIFRWKPDAVHFHDPELALLLLPLAFLSNKRLVCDVHEHPSAGIEGRQWIPKILRRYSAFFFSKLLLWSPYIYNEVILAEDNYVNFFPRRKNLHLVRNYALLPEPDIVLYNRYEGFDPQNGLNLIYVGSVIEERGALKLIDMVQCLASKYPNLTLDLVGAIRPRSMSVFLHEASQRSNGRIRLHGYLDLTELNTLMTRAHLGLIPLQPHPNYKESLATKFFDYMTYGLPCIASNFPLWKRFLDENPCGVTADVTSTQNLAEAVVELAENPKRLRKLSRNAYRIVREKFRWDGEGEKLLQIYRGLF